MFIPIKINSMFSVHSVKFSKISNRYISIYLYIKFNLTISIIAAKRKNIWLMLNQKTITPHLCLPHEASQARRPCTCRSTATIPCPLGKTDKQKPMKKGNKEVTGIPLTGTIAVRNKPSVLLSLRIPTPTAEARPREAVTTVTPVPWTPRWTRPPPVTSTLICQPRGTQRGTAMRHILSR